MDNGHGIGWLGVRLRQVQPDPAWPVEHDERGYPQRCGLYGARGFCSSGAGCGAKIPGQVDWRDRQAHALQPRSLGVPDRRSLAWRLAPWASKS